MNYMLIHARRHLYSDIGSSQLYPVPGFHMLQNHMNLIFLGSQIIFFHQQDLHHQFLLPPMMQNLMHVLCFKFLYFQKIFLLCFTTLKIDKVDQVTLVTTCLMN